jgi:hypothetical protein
MKLEKVELRMTGGFTGIGGRWAIDLRSGRAEGVLTEDKIKALTDIIEKCRSEGSLSKDFSQPLEKNKSSPLAAMPDSQTFELDVDGQEVKWNDPAPSGLTAPPNLNQLKDWIRENVPRQPYMP